jgi:hypothetical protein
MAADAVSPGNVRATDRLSLVASVVGICRRVFARSADPQLHAVVERHPRLRG